MWVIVMLILIPLVILFICETGMPLVIILILSIFAFPLLVLLNSIMRKWVSDGSYDVNPHEQQINQKQKEHRIAQVKIQEKYDNDRIKDGYCKYKNIPLLRIPYWEFESNQYKLNLLHFINTNRSNDPVE